MELSCDQIRALLPHRYPFLLVDRVLDCTPGVSVHAIKCVTQNEMHFLGHFPEKSVMPGVLIIEALAQACGIAMLTLPGNEGKLALLGGVNKARFKLPVVPGDTMHLECQITKTRYNIVFGQGKALVDNKVAAEAEFSFAIIDSTKD